MGLTALFGAAATLAGGDRSADRPRLERTDGNTMAALLCRLDWQCERASHSDIRLLPKLSLGRDILPPALQSGLLDKPVGHHGSARFAPGELLADDQPALCFDIAADRFNRRRSRYRTVEPRAGRFYPRGYIAGVHGIVAQERTPFRVGRLSDGHLTVDLNHPLARRRLELTARIVDAWPAADTPDGRRHDLGELVVDDGPGMPARWREQPTDFWSDAPFSRLADEPDERFYSAPRLVQHLDGHCRAALRALHGDLIPPGARVLDLMTSWDSHLPDDLRLGALCGLGMNPEELAANPRLDERIVHDLNVDPTLPFADAAFDAVICTASVEYLVRPAEVFAELYRVLGPGGLLLMSFSDRWFPPKVINIWQEIHAFERPGLVLDYLDKAGLTELHTLSLRGLPRPADDKYADRLAEADPLFAVWGIKPH